MAVTRHWVPSTSLTAVRHPARTGLLQEVVYLVSQGADPDEIGLMNIDEQVPVLEYPQPGLDIIKELTSPRLIKSHLPYRFLPSDLHNGDSKVIYMARNPKDLVVSYYQFHRSLRTMSYRGTFQEFCRRFMNDKLGYGSWFEHVQEFWEHRMDSNVLFLKYEDMHRLSPPVAGAPLILTCPLTGLLQLRDRGGLCSCAGDCARCPRGLPHFILQSPYGVPSPVTAKAPLPVTGGQLLLVVLAQTCAVAQSIRVQPWDQDRGAGHAPPLGGRCCRQDVGPHDVGTWRASTSQPSRHVFFYGSGDVTLKTGFLVVGLLRGHDLVTMVEQLARFLGVSCDKAQLESLTEHCHQLVDQCCNAEALPVGRGRVGLWKDIFTVSMNEKFDLVYKQKMGKCDLLFDFHL
ncbi:Sulfotransferase 4A1 [Tupaia chinensis]|uniref:Sulfotransferase n=1 Tax=Tupaia chinensis TaxID=246437 RepID=L9KPX4_TUPCH|nr:Sulfotransferase 4A1 [Tupaia chinensis]